MRALSQQGHGPGDKDVAGYKKEEPQFVVLLFFVPSTVNLYGKPRRTVQISSVQEIANNPVYLCTRLSGNTRRQGERCAVIRGCYREIRAECRLQNKRSYQKLSPLCILQKYNIYNRSILLLGQKT